MYTIKDLEYVLNEKNINYSFHEVEVDNSSVDSHVKALGINYKEGLATLVYKADDKLVVLLRRDDRSVDMKKFKKLLKVKDFRFANQKELEKIGLKPGLASPFLIPRDVEVFLDMAALEMNKIICGTTDPKVALEVKIDDILENIKYEEIDVTFPNKDRQGGYGDSKYKILVSGITPSGSELHIGNYFGAIQSHIELQSAVEQSYFFIADLHALTTIKSKNELEKNIENVILDYLALGLDPEKSILFRQSQVPEHSELAIILANYVTYGHMQRMHAFKDKLAKGTDVNQINMGLFNYPILMAADILLYKPDAVPVGEDQKQHIELTRDVAQSFNRTVNKEYFPLPDYYAKSKKTSKVIGTDGERKMSKSIGNIIGIFDDEDIIKKQVMSSYTDPNRIHATDPGKVEGNPVFIYHDLLNDDKEEIDDLKKRYENGEVGDVEVKEKLFVAHKRKFSEARSRRIELSKNKDNIKKIIRKGSEKASNQASKNLQEIKEIVGL